MGVYAVIHTGGKQYRVSPGDGITVEKLTAQPGERIEIDQVYLLAHDGQIIVGDPVVKNAHVVAQVLDQKRGQKLIIFKHRRRKGYRNTTGHRQHLTDLRIIEIVHEGSVYKEPQVKQDPQKINHPAVKAASTKKSAPEKLRKTAKTMPEKKPVSAAKPDVEVAAPAPSQPEMNTHAERPASPAASPAAPAGESLKTPAGPATVAPALAKEQASPPPAVKPASPGKPTTPALVPAPPAKDPEQSPKEQPVVPPTRSQELERPVIPAKSQRGDQPFRSEASKRPALEVPSKTRGSWKIIGAIIAALAVVALLLLLGRDKQTSASAPSQEMSGKPEPVKPKPLVRDVKTRKTAPVGKPSAPAQPPD